MKRDSEHPIPDEILVHRAQVGDKNALDELLRRYQLRVFFHCAALLKDEDDAWDATQNTFLAVLRHLPQLRHAAAFPVWILRLATNRVRDDQRSTGRLVRLQELWAEDKPVTMVDTAAVPRLQIEDCLKLLQTEDRQLIRLRYVEGFSTLETATILDIPEGTVKSRLHSIRKKLRQLTGDECHD